MRSSVTVPEAKMNVLMSQLFGGTRTEVDGQHQRGGKVVKNPPANAGDAGNADLIPALGRSPGVGKGNSLQYFCLENPKVRGAWWDTVQGVVKSQT